LGRKYSEEKISSMKKRFSGILIDDNKRLSYGRYSALRMSNVSFQGIELTKPRVSVYSIEFSKY
jgi:hypothetical protein